MYADHITKKDTIAHMRILWKVAFLNGDCAKNYFIYLRKNKNKTVIYRFYVKLTLTIAHPDALSATESISASPTVEFMYV